MDRINGADTADIGQGRRGFKDENVVAGQAGTEVTAAHLNGIQEEIIKVIDEAGLELDANDWTQLWQAILILISNAIANIDTDRFLASVGGYDAGTNILTLNMSDSSTFDVDLTGLINDAVNNHLPFASDAEFENPATTGKIGQINQFWKRFLPKRLAGNSANHDEILYPVGSDGFLVGDVAGALQLAIPDITDDVTPLFGTVRVDDGLLGTANYEFRLHPALIGGTGGDDIMPTMTSNNAPAPVVVSASLTDGSNAAWKAFDGDDSSFWQTSTASGEQWLQMDHGSGNAKQIDKIELVSSVTSLGPYDFKFKGSNDGVTWTDLLVVVGRTLTTGRETYQLTDVSTSYRYHRFTSDNYTDVLRVNSLQLIDVVIPPSEQAGSWSAISVTADNPAFAEKFKLSFNSGTGRWFVTIGEFTQARSQASFALTSLRVGSEAAEWFEGWGQSVVQALSGAEIAQATTVGGQQGFYATSAGTQTIPASVPTTVQDWVISTQQNDLGDATFSNGLLTIGPATEGRWSFSCAIDSNTGVAYNDVRILLNGNRIALQSNAGAGSDTSPNASCASIRLVAGDEVKVVRYSEGGASTVIVSNSHFSGHRIG